MTPQMQAVESYLANGISVLPLRPASKLPAGRWKSLQSSRMGHDVAHSWWDGAVTPVAGVGIITGPVSGDLVVLDVEPEHTDFVRKNVKLPDSGTVLTARGGLHVYCRGQARSSKLSVCERNVGDIRGLGGYVVAPPTLTGHGAYSWAVPADFTSLPPMPAWAAPGTVRAPPATHLTRVSCFQPTASISALLAVLPARVGAAIKNPRPIPSWSEWVFLIAGECVCAGLDFQAFESLVEASIGDYVEERRHADARWLRRTYQQAHDFINRGNASAIEVRVFDMAEFPTTLSPRDGLVSRSRLEITFAVCGTPQLVSYRIPFILSDGSVSGDYWQFCRAFGVPVTVHRIAWPKSRARAVVQGIAVMRLIGGE